LICVEAKSTRKRNIQPNQARHAHGNRPLPHEESVRQTRVAVVEREGRYVFCRIVHQV
jgi:hypothetical protein